MTTNITIEKSRLLARLTAERDAHTDEFIKAQERYRERVIEVMDKNLADARDGRKIRTYIDLPEPRDYTDKYTEVIAALEWEVADTIELSRPDFNRLVLGKWEWAEDFRSNTQAYTTGALR